MTELTVVIPIYNAEPYLKKCLDSLLNQTYRDWNAILVDDGSTDASTAVCDEYAQMDSRITAIHIPNGGVSNARNVGIAMADSRYLAFIDADDWIDENYYDVIMSKVNESAQLYIGGVYQL